MPKELAFITPELVIFEIIPPLWLYKAVVEPVIRPAIVPLFIREAIVPPTLLNTLVEVLSETLPPTPILNELTDPDELIRTALKIAGSDETAPFTLIVPTDWLITKLVQEAEPGLVLAVHGSALVIDEPKSKTLEKII